MQVMKDRLKLVFWDWSDTLISIKTLMNFHKEKSRVAKESGIYLDMMQELDKTGIEFIPYAWSLVMKFAQNEAGAKSGIKQVIVTNASTKEMAEQLLYAPYHNFDLILTADKFKPKPDPEMFLYALNQLDIKPSESIFIGDSESDLWAARKMEIPFYKVNLTMQSYQTISSALFN